MEVPSKVNFDLLLFVIGIFLYLSPMYTNYVFVPNCIQSFGALACPDKLPIPVGILLVLLGAVSMFFGFAEMASNYDRDRRFKEIYYAIEISKKIEHFDKKNRKKLLTDETKKKLEEYVKMLLEEEPSLLDKLLKMVGLSKLPT